MLNYSPSPPIPGLESYLAPTSRPVAAAGRPRSLRVRDMPLPEQPVERMLRAGLGALSTAEVLACVLQTPDALNQAQQLLAHYGGLDQLLRLGHEHEMAGVLGTPVKQAVRVRAALELARRAELDRAAGDNHVVKIGSPSDVLGVLGPEMSHLEQEQLRQLILDTRNQVLVSHTIYVGSLNSSYVRVAEVFREPIRRQAASIILAHNHPSGDPSPSPEDITVTREIVSAGKLLSIDVLDHLIIGGPGRWVSLRERGLGFDG